VSYISSPAPGEAEALLRKVGRRLLYERAIGKGGCEVFVWPETGYRCEECREPLSRHPRHSVRALFFTGEAALHLTGRPVRLRNPED
jgi:hypothetical protein